MKKYKYKYEDIVECLQPHRFRLVEDEFMKEVRILGKIRKIASSTAITSSSRLTKVTKTKQKDKISSKKKNLAKKQREASHMFSKRVPCVTFKDERKVQRMC